ncbi:MAG TPA: hypothetical protein VHC95_04990 [Opitutales bacterium]|nr:hypothetical protein [Opitutales bacterium]
MKTLITSIIVLLLCAGCESPNKGGYTLVTPQQIHQKRLHNEVSRDYVWNQWRYAGSDDQYDYIYEYVPGSVIPYGFHCYKVNRGELAFDLRYDFDPNFGDNMRIF